MKRKRIVADLVQLCVNYGSVELEVEKYSVLTLDIFLFCRLKYWGGQVLINGLGLKFYHYFCKAFGLIGGGQAPSSPPTPSVIE